MYTVTYIYIYKQLYDYIYFRGGLRQARELRPVAQRLAQDLRAQYIVHNNNNDNNNNN